MAVDSAINSPPLESGDRLTRQGFERRYTAASQIQKAELVEGVVYVASPVRANRHSRLHAALMAWLGVYWMLHPALICTTTQRFVLISIMNLNRMPHCGLSQRWAVAPRLVRMTTLRVRQNLWQKLQRAVLPTTSMTNLMLTAEMG